jgi:hypothetical protein
MDSGETAIRVERRRTVIPQAAVGGESGRVAVGPHRRSDDVKLEVTTENGVVQTIHITCSCGRVIQLDCQY